jgi:hypothetical protein
VGNNQFNHTLMHDVRSVSPDHSPSDGMLNSAEVIAQRRDHERCNLRVRRCVRLPECTANFLCRLVPFLSEILLKFDSQMVEDQNFLLAELHSRCHDVSHPKLKPSEKAVEPDRARKRQI